MVFQEQYEHIQSSRRVLFDYCKTITPNDFINQNTSFGRGGSIRNLLVHNANCYEFWIGEKALQKTVPFIDYDTVHDMQDVEKLFEKIDFRMMEFIEKFGTVTTEIAYEINGTNGVATPLKLFTHVITHEFHHKGQILSLSRHLGYIPVDTDIIR
ncbi:DinB family protein [Flavobacterium sp.]|uniref:DinB family protein n=1 Tax=Flavobacterium sp. TaxID=239 RepID=UPI002FD96E4B